MAARKKVAKVVVHEAYLNILIEKAEMLDDMFEDGAFHVAPDDFKRRDQLNKVFDKLPSEATESEVYQEPNE
jgi:hypothetical protein